MSADGKTTPAQDAHANLPPLPEWPHVPAQQDESGNVTLSRKQLDDIYARFRSREEALQMRIDALAFSPAQALSSLRDPSSSQGETGTAMPQLGVRLLQRVDELQRENEDLAERLREVIDVKWVRERDVWASELQGTRIKQAMQELTGRCTRTDPCYGPGTRAVRRQCC